jgi:hypothetical protein
VVLAVRLFYFIGPALAIWAVVLAVIGFTRPGFPRRIGGERLVIGISLALVLGVILSAMIDAKFEHTEHAGGGAAHQKPVGGG